MSSDDPEAPTATTTPAGGCNQDQVDEGACAAEANVAVVSVVEMEPLGDDDTPASSTCQNNDGACAPPPPKPSEQHFTLRHWALMIELLLLTFAVMYVNMCVVPMLPMINSMFPGERSWAPWILSSYNIVGGVWTPIAGSLADMYGTKWVALGSLAAFSAGQIGAGCSRTFWVLLAFRFVQGLGMAVYVLSFTTIRKLFPQKYVQLGIGLISANYSIGISVGLVGGAATVDGISTWQNVFFTTLPLIVIVAVAFFFTLPPNPPAPAGSPKRRKRPDVVGAVLIAAGVVMLLAGLTIYDKCGWTSPVTLCLIIIGFLLIVAFGLVEWFLIKDPLVPVRLIFTRNLVFVAAISFTYGFALYAFFTLAPYLYLSPLPEHAEILPARHKTQLMVGVLLLPFGLPMLVIAPLTTWLGKKVGYSDLLTLSFAILVAGAGAAVRFHYTLASVIVINICVGCCTGITSVAMMNTLAVYATREQFGAASGTNTLCRIIGSSVSPVIIGIVLEHSPVRLAVSASRTVSVPSDAAYRTSYAIVAAVGGAGMLLSLGLSGHLAFLRKKRRAQQQQQSTAQAQAQATPPAPAVAPSA
eukprot:m51a1_g4252 hypothetical protein (584) ;mRNA; r:208730-210709